MALSKERLGEIALFALQLQLEEKGLRLDPREIKRDLHNEAKKLGVPIQEFAEMVRAVYKTAYERTMAAIDEVSPPDKVEDKEKFVDRLRGQ